MSTKIRILFASALAFAVAESAHKPLIQIAVDTCAVENGLPATGYEHFVFFNLNYKLEDCVAACAMKKLGTMSPNGVYTGAEVKRLIRSASSDDSADDGLIAMIDNCAKKHGLGEKDPCQTAERLRMCYEGLIRQETDDDSMLNASINQFLLFTLENYLDAYPEDRRAGNDE